MTHARITISLLSTMLLGLLFFHASADEPKTAKTASLVTYNVLADPEQADQRVPTLLKTIGDCDADVIALQEVAPWFIRRLAKADWFKKYHAPKTGGNTDGARRRR